MTLRWPFKDPDEVLDYDVDWTFRLYSKAELAAALAQQNAGQPVTIVPADTIVTSTFTLPSGITANSTTNGPTATKVWISGGVEGVSYLITNEVRSAGGRLMDQTIKLKIKSK
jgi:hypothetical protein